MTKKQQLEQIANEIANCKVCRKGKSGLPVPGEGDSDAKIMFVGEAPGREESQTGRPFVGRSGRFLTELIESIGLKRKDVYITSPVKYFPGYRAPTISEITHGRIHLQKQIEVIKPKLIVLLGNVASRGALGRSFKANKMHGQILEENGIKYFFTFHPSAALRFLKTKSLIRQDFQKLDKFRQSSLKLERKGE